MDPRDGVRGNLYGEVKVWQQRSLVDRVVGERMRQTLFSVAAPSNRRIAEPGTLGVSALLMQQFAFLRGARGELIASRWPMGRRRAPDAKETLQPVRPVPVMFVEGYFSLFEINDRASSREQRLPEIQRVSFAEGGLAVLPKAGGPAGQLRY